MRKNISLAKVACLLLMLGLVAGCTAPRSVINSGKVTAPGQFKFGGNFGGNIATEPISQLDDITNAAVDAITKKDTILYDNEIDVFSRALVAYSLDPVGPTFDFYVRYGIAPRFDAGYKYASGAHALDVQYQFLGPTGTPLNPGEGKWYGSIALQYAAQSSGLVNQLLLDKLVPVFKFTASRRDITVPLIFSTSFGPEEEIGSFSFGVVYNHTFIKYGFEPRRLFRKYGEEYIRVESVMEKNNFPSFGFFLNGKIGYRYVYLLPALTVYYQNYGTYSFLEDREYSFSGMTFIPSLGLQVVLGGNKNTGRNVRR
ncbi:hypothetical protein [Pontibacter harenae]|uniref:hypothetical protein n=1 Tax=Pontibacter harenae TaxID=2894083 RepID=UPI001E3059CA|nr:hypothetical protein [Pontibacter harenae]MCC9168019.1 hypothetical protein [Pontibacter harenae]